MQKEEIKRKCTCNISDIDENGKYGYQWIKKLKLSYQYKDANGTMKEILNMIKINNYSIDT